MDSEVQDPGQDWFQVRTSARESFKRAKYEDAEKLFLKALAHAKRMADKPTYLAISLNDLGCHYLAIRRDELSESLLRRSLSLRLKLAGPNAIEVSDALNNLALIATRRRDWVEAEVMMRRVIEIRQLRLGPAHSQTLVATANLGRLLRNLQRTDEALPLLREALVAARRVIDRDGVEVAAIGEALGGVYVARGNFRRALALFARVVRIRERLLPHDHHEVIDAKEQLALCAARREWWPEAAALYYEVVPARECQLGATHLSLANLLLEAGRVYRRVGDLESAEAVLRRSLELQERVHGAAHVRVADALNVLAASLAERGKVTNAIELFERARSICAAREPEHSPRMLEILCNMGLAHSQDHRLDDAISYCRRALYLVEKHIGFEVPEALRPLECQISILRAWGKHKSAEELESRFRRIQNWTCKIEGPTLQDRKAPRPRGMDR